MLEEKQRQMSASIERVEREEMIKDVEWNRKREEMREELRLLCQSYLLNPALQKMMNQKMQELSPI